MYDAFDAPLTDYSYSDSESEVESVEGGDEGPTSRREPAAGNSPRLLPAPFDSGPTRKQKKNQRATSRKRKCRAELRPEGGPKRVSMKRGFEGTKVVFKLPLDMGPCAGATAPGWVGKPLPAVPRLASTLEVLEGRHKMARFDWDGVCVPDPPAANFYLRRAQNAPSAARCGAPRRWCVCGPASGRRVGGRSRRRRCRTEASCVEDEVQARGD